MGDQLSFLAPFYVDEFAVPDDVVVERTVEVLREYGLETGSEGDPEYVDSYELNDDDAGGSHEGPLAQAAIDLADVGKGKISGDFHGYHVRVSFNLATDDPLEWPPLDLAGLYEYAFTEEDVSRGAAREVADDFAAAIAALAEEFDPWYVFAQMYANYGDMAAYPDGRPPDSGVEDLAWVSVFGEPWFEGFGGRERMLDAPAYDVRELDDGNVFVRTQAIPRNLRSDVEGRGELSAYEYLFAGKSREELTDELAERRSTYVDPFRDLESGELASDVVVCQDHADFDLPEVHYEHVPPREEIDPCGIVVCRRDGDALWDEKSGTFVRRLVDEDGGPKGDLPKDVAPEEEFVSRVVGTEHEEPPADVDMIRMDDPDDRSLLMMTYDIFEKIGEGSETEGEDGDDDARAAGEED